MKIARSLLGLACGLALALQSTGTSWAKAPPANPCAQIAAQLQQVAREAEISAPPSVGCEVLAEAEFATYHHQLAQALGLDLNLHSDSKILTALFIVPESYPYAECVVQASASGALALYDPLAKKLVIKENSNISELVILHELVHALQDEMLELRSYAHDPKLSFDQIMVRTALLEGHAIVISEALSSDKAGSSSEAPSAVVDSRCTPPKALATLFDYPYDFGTIVARRSRSGGGNAAIKKLLMRPPNSLLDLITGASNPVATLPRKHDSSACRQDTLGIALVQTIAKLVLNREDSLRIARRWVSDDVRVCLAKSGDEDSVWRVTWESEWQRESDAASFFQLLSLIHI